MGLPLVEGSLGRVGGPLCSPPGMTGAVSPARPAACSAGALTGLDWLQGGVWGGGFLGTKALSHGWEHVPTPASLLELSPCSSGASGMLPLPQEERLLAP